MKLKIYFLSFVLMIIFSFLFSNDINYFSTAKAAGIGNMNYILSNILDENLKETLSFTYASIFEDVYCNYLSYRIPNYWLNVNLTYFNFGVIKSIDGNEFSANYLMLNIEKNFLLLGKFYFILSPYYSMNKISDYSINIYNLNLGMYWHYNNILYIAASAYNVLPFKFGFSNFKEILPSGYGLATKYKLKNFSVYYNIDIQNFRNINKNLFGIEILLTKNFIGRSGYDIESQTTALGISFVKEKFQLDLAYNISKFSPSQYVSLTYFF